MQAVIETKFRDREHAGNLLARRLEAYRSSDAIVVGIPAGGVAVGAAIARVLSLPLAVLPCRKIQHPVDNNKTIGSITADEVFLRHCSHTIPQDYISHQIALLKNALKHDRHRYSSDEVSTSFFYKTVILVDDVLLSGDALLAGIRGLRKQMPLKIVVAIPVVSAEAARIVRGEADAIVFLRMDNGTGSPDDYFSDFSEVDPCEVNGPFQVGHNA